MSNAELLREAAREMRSDWEPCRDMEGIMLTDSHWRRGKTWLAVADWLDREAALHEAMHGVGNLLQMAAKQLGKGELRIEFSRDADGMAASTMPQAIAVARAYLGETA